MAGQAPIIGIDLGTTFSAMAFVNEEAVPEIICNREGKRITPSVVLFDGDSPIVGTPICSQKLWNKNVSHSQK